jgi:hypothetical protein
MGRAVVLNVQIHGHVNPTLAVVQELVARGEEVFYYSSEVFKERLEQVGAIYRSHDTLFTNLALQADPADFSLLVIGESLHVLPQVLDEIRALQPSYIIYDSLCITGRFLAQILNLPAILLSSTHAGGIFTLTSVPRKNVLTPLDAAGQSSAVSPDEQPRDVLMIRGDALDLVPSGMRRPTQQSFTAPATLPTPPQSELVPAARSRRSSQRSDLRSPSCRRPTDCRRAMPRRCTTTPKI